MEEEEGQLDEERLESNALASTSDSGNDLSAEARQGFNRLDSLIDDWLVKMLILLCTLMPILSSCPTRLHILYMQ